MGCLDRRFHSPDPHFLRRFSVNSLSSNVIQFVPALHFNIDDISIALQCDASTLTDEERLSLPITREAWYPLLRYEALTQPAGTAVLRRRLKHQGWGDRKPHISQHPELAARVSCPPPRGGRPEPEEGLLPAVIRREKAAIRRRPSRGIYRKLQFV
eukprot:COSAG02_NODE_32226_length_519_cov_20.814286_1_plen_155_part_01